MTNKMKSSNFDQDLPRENSQGIQNIKMIQLVLNKTCDKNSEHMQDNNGNNYQQCVPTYEMSKCISQQNNTSTEKNMQIQKNVDITVTNKNTSQLNVNNKLVHSNLIYSKLLDETLIHKINDCKNKNSCVKHNLLNAKLLQLKHNYFVKENFILRDSPSKIGHRKKLYTAEDSPTDLTKMKCYNKNTVFQSQQDLHPALDFGCKLRKHKVFKIRKRNYLHTFNRGLMNINQLNSSHYDKLLQRLSNQRAASTITNNNIKLDYTRSINYNKSENLMECNNKECMNMFLSTNEYINTENNIVTKELTNKKLNEVIVDPHNVNYDNRKFKRQNSMVTNLTDLNPTICLTRLPKFKVRKFDKQDKMVIKFDNLSPVVRLKQLSKIEIQKYKKSTNTMTNHGNLNPIVQLKKLSSLDIKKYRNANDENTK